MSKKSIFFLKNRYYAHFPICRPSFLVARIAGREIETAAKAFFKGKVIDIGCGEKLKRELIEAYVSGYVGVDHDRSQHDLSEVERIGTAYRLPARDGEFESVLCTAVLEHLEEPKTALAEAFRVLHPGGYAVYTIPLFWHVHEEPRDFFRYTKYGIDHLFRSAGFQIIGITPLSGFWVTFGSEFNYYLESHMRKWSKPFVCFPDRHQQSDDHGA